jgi:hypothetical protein
MIRWDVLGSKPESWEFFTNIRGESTGSIVVILLAVKETVETYGFEGSKTCFYTVGLSGVWVFWPKHVNIC